MHIDRVRYTRGDKTYEQILLRILKKLEERRIRVTLLPTRQAVKAFNSLHAKGERCAGCFHLTC